MEECDRKGMNKALNKSGTFFHFAALEKINGNGWRTAIEVPVSGAPFVSDPMKRAGAVRDGVVNRLKFQQLANESQDQSSRIEQTMDILASKTIGGVKFHLCVEVKKRNPEYVKFVFLKPQDYTGGFDVVSKVSEKKITNLMEIPRIDSNGRGLFVNINQLDLNLDIGKIYDFGKTLTKDNEGNYSDGDDSAYSKRARNRKKRGYKFQDNPLRKAAIQVVEGTYGIILDSVMHEITNRVNAIKEYFVPIIVTNAEIYTCSYEIADMDKDSGEVGKLDFEERDYVVYKSPTPAKTTFPNQATGVYTPDQMRQASRWTILVANMKGLKILLDGIERQAQNTTLEKMRI